MAIQPSDNLLRARRALEELSFYQLLTDWQWNNAVKKWVLKCSLTVKPGNLIPDRTDWFIVADEEYPLGDIEFYPGKEAGLTRTFQHQSHNAFGKLELPWREGKICAQTSMRYASRRVYDIEPFSIDERLSWRVSRAHEWLVAAAEGRLAEKGEPFELPEFPVAGIEKVGFVEDEKSFLSWQEQSSTSGLATLVQLEGVVQWTAVASFSNERGMAIHEVKYGIALTDKALRKITAIWIRLSRVPVLSPWQAPATFGELRSVLSAQDVDFNTTFLRFARNLRDGKQHFMLIGFPIPAITEGENQMYHWQGMRLPALSHGKLNGFRPNETNYGRNDIQKALADNVGITWAPSKNWAEKQIRTRGQASSQLTNANILLVGGGALGSSIAEQLVREGCKRLTIIDGDKLDVGNLCRHTLSIEHVGKFKAESLAMRLNRISPHVIVQNIRHDFHEHTAAEQRIMQDCDIIIDCTGNDELAHQLSTFLWSGEKLFVSVSLGILARRLFLFAARGVSFPHDEFMGKITPWLKKELEEYEGLQLPREGIGCWHPVFPARSSDVWMMSAIAVKYIDACATNPPSSSGLNVYEQCQKDGMFTGITMVAGL